MNEWQITLIAALLVIAITLYSWYANRSSVAMQAVALLEQVRTILNQHTYAQTGSSMTTIMLFHLLRQYEPQRLELLLAYVHAVDPFACDQCRFALYFGESCVTSV